MLFPFSGANNVAVRAPSAAAFTPASITGSIWFDGADTSTLWSDAGSTTITNSDGVYQWDAKGDNGGFSVLQTDAAARPAWNSGGYLTFDGIADHLLRSAALFTETNLNARAGYSAYALVKPNPGTDRRMISEGNSGSTTQAYAAIQSAAATASNFNIWWRADDNGTVIAPTETQAAGVLDNTLKVIGSELDFNGTSPSLNIYDGTSLGAGTITTPANADTTTVDRFAIGALVRSTISNFFAMDLHQLVLVPDVLSSGDRADLIAYLEGVGGL